MLARFCAAAVAVGGKATERFITRRGEGGVASGAASAGSGVGIGLAAGDASMGASVASGVGSGVVDGVAPAGGGEGGEAWPTSCGAFWEREGEGGDCDPPGVATAGGEVAGAAVAVGTVPEAAPGVGSATGAASAGEDGVVIAEAAGEVATGVRSDAGEEDDKIGDAAAAGETDPGENVTRLSLI